MNQEKKDTRFAAFTKMIAAALMIFFLFVGCIVALVNLVFDLPYAKWAYDNMPRWFAPVVVLVNSACIIIVAFPEKNFALKSLFAFLFVLTFLLLSPGYQLSPLYIKVLFFIALCFSATRLLLGTSKRKKKYDKGNIG